MNDENQEEYYWGVEEGESYIDKDGVHVMEAKLVKKQGRNPDKKNSKLQKLLSDIHWEVHYSWAGDISDETAFKRIKVMVEDFEKEKLEL